MNIASDKRLVGFLLLVVGIAIAVVAVRSEFSEGGAKELRRGDGGFASASEMRLRDSSSKGPSKRERGHGGLGIATGEDYGADLAGRHLAADRLHEELEALKKSLPTKAFNKVLEMIGSSAFYSPSEKADVFNRFLPYDDGPRVAPVYNEVLIDWGITLKNHEAFFEFVQNLESPEIREMLAAGYASITFESPSELRDLIQAQSDLNTPSYFGDGVPERAGAISLVITSMIQGKHITLQEAMVLVEDMDIDGELKEALVKHMTPYKPEQRK